LFSEILLVITAGNKKSKCSKGGEVGSIPLSRGQVHSSYHFLLSSQGLHEAELHCSTLIPGFHTWPLCVSQIFSASGWWICNSHNYCTT